MINVNNVISHESKTVMMFHLSQDWSFRYSITMEFRNDLDYTSTEEPAKFRALKKPTCPVVGLLKTKMPSLSWSLKRPLKTTKSLLNGLKSYGPRTRTCWMWSTPFAQTWDRRGKSWKAEMLLSQTYMPKWKNCTWPMMQWSRKAAATTSMPATLLGQTILVFWFFYFEYWIEGITQTPIIVYKLCILLLLYCCFLL